MDTPQSGSLWHFVLIGLSSSWDMEGHGHQIVFFPGWLIGSKSYNTIPDPSYNCTDLTKTVQSSLRPPNFVKFCPGSILNSRSSSLAPPEICEFTRHHLLGFNRLCLHWPGFIFSLFGVKAVHPLSSISTFIFSCRTWFYLCLLPQISELLVNWKRATRTCWKNINIIFCFEDAIFVHFVHSFQSLLKNHLHLTNTHWRAVSLKPFACHPMVHCYIFGHLFILKGDQCFRGPELNKGSSDKQRHLWMEAASAELSVEDQDENHVFHTLISTTVYPCRLYNLISGVHTYSEKQLHLRNEPMFCWI